MLTRGPAQAAFAARPSGSSSSSSAAVAPAPSHLAGAGDPGGGLTCRPHGPPAGGADRKARSPPRRLPTATATLQAAYEEVPAQVRYLGQADDDPEADPHSVRRVEVFFDKPVKLSYMYLKNHYVHSLDVDGLVDSDEAQWMPLLEDELLMSSAHCDAEGQDSHLLDFKTVLELAGISRVLALRILLKQPSPLHKRVSIMACKFFVSACATAAADIAAPTPAALPPSCVRRAPAIGMLQGKKYHLTSILAE